MSSTRASKPLKTKLFKESTINSYAWHFKLFQVNFHVLPLKPSKYFSFCDTVLAHEDIVVGFVIFLTKLSTPTCMLHQLVTNFAKSWLGHCNIKKKKKRKKRHSSMV
jgi:hypothetical protein